MKYEPIGPGKPWHSASCRCPECTPPSPDDLIASPIELASIIAIAGVVVALVLIEILSAITGAPGVEVMFG